MQDELNGAIQLHQEGYLDRAARAYESMLARDPQQPDALHLLGVLAMQQGNPARAVDLIERAIVTNATVGAFHCNLAEAYRALGAPERAVDCCLTALSIQPHYPEALNNLGLALQALGRREEAVDRLGEAIRQQPSFAMAHNNLGTIARELGDTDQAMGHFRRAVAIDPRLAIAQSNLGQALLEEHQPAAAAAHCRAAERLMPHFAEAHNNLGNVLRELGQLAEAKTAYAEALRLSPDLALTYSNMGQAFQEEGKLDDAVAWYRRALAREPGLAIVHSHLASALEEKDDHAGALSEYEAALRLDPGLAEAHNGLGFLHHEQGNYDEARRLYREALRLKPRYAAAHCNLGIVLEEMGAFEDAQAEFRAAISHDPHLAVAHAQLATMLGGKLPQEDIEALRQLLSGPYLSAAKRSALHFGLAHVLDARRDFAEAAAHLRHANSLRLQEWVKLGKGYAPHDHRKFVDDLIAAFSPDAFERTKGFGLETERPLFIFGLPRSGTTLIEQILASHSQVLGAGELRLARASFESMPAIMSLATQPIECVGKLDEATVRAVAHRHLRELERLGGRALRVADKMPDNYLYLGLIAMLFPRAKLVHCRRDPRDIAVSCWMTNFRQINWANDVDHIASRFAEYRRLMDHWRRVLPVPLLEVDYEETVADLESVARRLVAWAGLEWEPACLAFHKTARHVRTASVSQVRQPIYSRSVGRWKNYEKDLGPTFDRLRLE